MDRAQKPVVVSDLNAVFGEVGVVVVTRNLGLTVAQSTDLRTKMREAGATYKVTKNSLAKIASKGTSYEQIGDMLTGPIALASSVDPVAAAKVAIDFAKTTDKLEIVGGAMGDTLLDANGVKALASMPLSVPSHVNMSLGESKMDATSVKMTVFPMLLGPTRNSMSVANPKGPSSGADKAAQTASTEVAPEFRSA